MSAGIIGPVGGFLPPLSASVKAEIERRFPQLPVGAIENEFGFYVLYRDANLPSSEDVRLEITRTLKAARALQRQVEGMSRHAANWFDQGCLVSEGRMLRNELTDVLKAAERGLIRTQPILPKGRGLHPHAALVRNLARIVAEVGLTIDARPNGPLVYVIDALLRDAGEDPSDTRKIVSEAIKRWKLPPQLQG